MNTHNTQILIYNKHKPGIFQEWLILRLGQEIHNMILEQLLLPESNNMLKHTYYINTDLSKELRELQWPKVKQFVSQRK